MFVHKAEAKGLKIRYGVHENLCLPGDYLEFKED